MSKPQGATRVVERDNARFWLVKRGQLTVERGPDQGQTVEIGAAPVVVGTGKGAQLRLSDSSVSAEHLRFTVDEQGLFAEDLDSTNGTFVGGLNLQRAYLVGPTEFEVGDSLLSFRFSGDEVEIPISSKTRFGPLLGHSPAMRAVFSVLERVAATDLTVLLEGASGTGKDLAARAIHECSDRGEELFIPVDCGSIPGSLLESELFGHAKGAFTGATADKEGPFEAVGRGTVFLDEIGELPLDLQPKLLRVLENRQVRRVGESQPRNVEARILAATNRDLAQAVKDGTFRQDLFYRLSVVRVRMPSLRERKEEIPRLVSSFLRAIEGAPESVSPELMATLSSYRWPGNVRELRNVVQRIAAVPEMPTDFYMQGLVGDGASEAPSLSTDVPYLEAKQAYVERFEKAYISDLLKKCNGNVSEVSRAAKLSRQSCHRLIKRYGLTSKA